MLTWELLWEDATRLEQEFKNDDRSQEYWHMDYVRGLNAIALYIQRHTDDYPATKAWANTWLSNHSCYLIDGFQSLKNALQSDKPDI
jgi:hypothetical protein